MTVLNRNGAFVTAAVVDEEAGDDALKSFGRNFSRFSSALIFANRFVMLIGTICSSTFGFGFGGAL